MAWGWRDGSVVHRTDCSVRGPRFESQYPHGSSQLPATLVPGDPTSSHTHACRQNTNVHKTTISNKNLLCKLNGTSLSQPCCIPTSFLYTGTKPTRQWETAFKKIPTQCSQDTKTSVPLSPLASLPSPKVYRSRISLCSPGYSGTSSVDQVVFERRDPAAFASHVLGLESVPPCLARLVSNVQIHSIF